VGDVLSSDGVEEEVVPVGGGASGFAVEVAAACDEVADGAAIGCVVELSGVGRRRRRVFA